MIYENINIMILVFWHGTLCNFVDD